MTKRPLPAALVRWSAILLMLGIGLIHIMTSQRAYETAAYIGYLFAANFLGAAIAAIGIYYRQFAGWLVGLAVVLVSIVGYAVSWAIGAQGVFVAEWFAPYGVAALAADGLFVVIFAQRPWLISAQDVSAMEAPRLGRAPLVIGAILVTVLSFVPYQSLNLDPANLFSSASAIRPTASAFSWDEVAFLSLDDEYVCSLDQAKSATPMTFDELEQRYGVRVSLAAVSMMDSIVDVRLKVIDPAKARTLLQKHAALLVNQESLVLAPNMHAHRSAVLQPRKAVSLFFPTQQIIRSGSQVSLVFGTLVTEPLIVK